MPLFHDVILSVLQPYKVNDVQQFEVNTPYALIILLLKGKSTSY